MRIALWVIALALALGVGCKGKSKESEMQKPTGDCNVDGDCVTKCDSKDPCRCVKGACVPRSGGSPATPSGSATPAGSSTAGSSTAAPTPPAGSSAPAAGSSTSAPAPAEPARPFTVDMSAFDRSCKTKADCSIVKADPCDKCSCGAAPIARSQSMKFETALGAIDCKKAPKDDRRCGECRGNLPDCVDGKCIAVPEK
jgi:hypothetical protein